MFAILMKRNGPVPSSVSGTDLPGMWGATPPNSLLFIGKSLFSSVDQYAGLVIQLRKLSATECCEDLKTFY